jgi:anti-anti-sigma factor
MGDYHHIQVSDRKAGEKPVAVVEILDEKLWAPAALQDLARELTSVLEAGRTNILLDLARVDYISSAALNRLINFHKRVQTAGGDLKLCNMRPSIEDVFVATRFNQILDIHETPTAALAAF